MSTEPTVFIVEDNDIVRERLSCLVKSVKLKDECYASAKDFLDNYNPEQPGCLVTDVRMQGMSGLELLEKLIAENISLPIIVITCHGDVSMAVRAMKVGAFEFFEKPVNNQLLLERIQQAIKHDARQRLAHNKRNELLKRLVKLTPREHEIMIHVVKGKSNKIIARELEISNKTVEAHRASMMKKMQANNLADLVHIGVICELL